MQVCKYASHTRAGTWQVSTPYTVPQCWVGGGQHSGIVKRASRDTVLLGYLPEQDPEGRLVFDMPLLRTLMMERPDLRHSIVSRAKVHYYSLLTTRYSPLATYIYYSLLTRRGRRRRAGPTRCVHGRTCSTSSLRPYPRWTRPANPNPNPDPNPNPNPQPRP